MKNGRRFGSMGLFSRDIKGHNILFNGCRFGFRAGSMVQIVEESNVLQNNFEEA